MGYKAKHGTGLDFVRKVYHQCKLCGEEMLLSNDEIAQHVRYKHKMSCGEYTRAHMKLARVSKNEESAKNDGDKAKNGTDGENNTKKVKLKNKDGLKWFGSPKKKGKSTPKQETDRNKEHSASKNSKEDKSSMKKNEKDSTAKNSFATESDDSLGDEPTFTKSWFDGNTFACQ